MRPTLSVLLLSLSFSLPALGNGDFEITSVTSNQTAAQTGAPITLTIGMKANGPDESRDINLNIFNSWGEPLNPVSATVPAGWQCSPVFVNCWAATMAAGTEAQLVLQLTTPSVVQGGEFTLTVHASSVNDSNSGNNGRTLPVTMQTSTRVADLQIDLTAPQSPSPEGSPLTYVFNAKNAGPQDLIDVRMGVNLNGPSLGALTLTGAGWNCNVTPLNAACSRASLAAGAAAPLELKLTAPSTPGELSTEARLFATQAHVDPNPSNERKQSIIFIGDASDWSRVLIPVTQAETPGANGSLWKTELTGLIESTTPVFTDPSGCGGLEDPCQPPPLLKPFDLRRESLIWGDFPAQFIYVRKPDAKKLIVSTRVYDASKNTETAGAFVPTARDEDFSAEGFTLVGIPVAPQFRSMLRVYDSTGSAGEEVEVALWGDDEFLPLYVGSARLISDPNRTTLTTALLPAHPSLAQIDLSAVIPARYSRVRVEVGTRNTSLRLWGFVSITNNQTSHVTVVAP